ncbi:MAG: hypothetical protein KC636_22630 [Myxococcales bacterium]|nr:hypothetical protein [Myxococcales bacterium]
MAPPRDPVPAILSLAPALFARNPARAQEAGDAIDRILRGAPIRLIPALDRGFRDGGLHRKLGRAFLEVDAQRVAQLETLGPAASAALGVASLLRSGYAREAATRRLRARLDPLATAFLINRVNDYVRPIAALAWSGLEARLAPERARLLVPGLPLILRMRAWVRAGEGERERLLDALRRRDLRCQAALREGLSARDDEVVLACCQLLATHLQGTEEMRALLLAALRARAPGPRRWAADAALRPSLTPPPVRATLLPTLAADRSPAIRLRALRALADAGDLEAVAALAFDRNAEVRHQARMLLARTGDVRDYRGRALATLGREASTRDEAIAALATLSDFGRLEDRGVVAARVDDPRASVAREAARTLAAIDRLAPP